MRPRPLDSTLAAAEAQDAIGAMQQLVDGEARARGDKTALEHDVDAAHLELERRLRLHTRKVNAAFPALDATRSRAPVRAAERALGAEREAAAGRRRSRTAAGVPRKLNVR
jgi:hypothetical protein